MQVILFDIDGLVIEKRTRYFSEKLSEERAISNEAIQQFFKTDFEKCLFGSADLKVELAPYLSKWGWEGSVDDFLTYWFESERTVDEEVLAVVKDLRTKGTRCYCLLYTSD